MEEQVAQAIYDKGAYCGNCEYISWGSCPECVECCIGYAQAAILTLNAIRWVGSQ